MFKFILLCMIALQISVFSQTNYLVKLTNPSQIDSKTVEFDIKIKSTSSEFNLTSYQCAFTFGVELGKTDSINLKYLPNTSEFSNGPVYIIGHDNSDGIDKLIFISGIGNDMVSKTEKLIGRFKITCSRNFSVDLLNLKWNFSGSVNTILTDSNFADITYPSNFINMDNTITGVAEKDNIPQNYSLSQNYPNPFNPTTKIQYTVPAFSGNIKSQKVVLKVYDILGREITTLVNDVKAPGSHEVEFNAKQLASGVYIYRLQAGNFTSTKKMNLIK